ncbi:hypothetical protein L6R50_14675 [Myxococcota bacterium]|nr:hypothetical protein [Myxococcota bacterium]
MTPPETRFPHPHAGRAPGWVAVALALLTIAWGSRRDGRGDVLLLCIGGAAFAISQAASLLRRRARLLPSALLLEPEGVSIPFTAVGAVARGLVVTRPGRGVPGPLVVDAAAASMGLDRLRIRNTLRLLDRDGRLLLQVSEDRVARLSQLAEAVARACGLVPLDGLGDVEPYPAPEGLPGDHDHLPALLLDLRSPDPSRRDAAEDLLRRAGRDDLVDAGPERDASPRTS